MNLFLKARLDFGKVVSSFLVVSEVTANLLVAVQKGPNLCPRFIDDIYITKRISVSLEVSKGGVKVRRPAEVVHTQRMATR